MWLHRKSTMVVASVIGLVMLAAGACAAQGYDYGAIRVRNLSDRLVQLFIDGNPVGSIAAGLERSFNLLPGAHMIVARDDSGRSMERQVHITTGQTTIWRVGPAQPDSPAQPQRYGWLEMTNRSDYSKVYVSIDGEHAAIIAPLQSRRFALQPGSHDIVVRDDSDQSTEHVVRIRSDETVALFVPSSQAW